MVQSQLEAPGQLKSEKTPDGVTMVLETASVGYYRSTPFAPSYTNHATIAAVAALVDERKCSNSTFFPTHSFTPLANETSGEIGQSLCYQRAC